MLDTTFLPAQSSKHEKMSEAARGCSGMVHSYLHSQSLLALTWKPSGSSNAELPAANEESAHHSEEHSHAATAH